MTDDERYKLIAQITLAFTPGTPISSKDLFAGRQREVERVVATVFQPGQHVVVWGERGVGKTSLANTIYDVLVVMGKYDYQIARLNCSEKMSFEDIWKATFRQLHASMDGEDVSLDKMLAGNPHSENVRETFDLMNNPSIVILDEFDRVTDKEVHTAIADTIKTLSDNNVPSTLILVGVADSLDQLIAEHLSIERAFRQIPMRRMSKTELLEIVDRGLKQCEGMAIDPATKERIADYSHGLPHFTHLLAREAALNVVRAGRTYIMMDDLEYAVKESVDSHLQSLLSDFQAAVKSARGFNFKPVLLACALAPKDEHGFFYANQVAPPLRSITKKNYDIPSFARHLKAFSGSSRGSVLEQRGRQYRFVKPIMEPYVILRGLADGLISEDQLSRPSMTSNEQPQLSLLLPSDLPSIEL